MLPAVAVEGPSTRAGWGNQPFRGGSTGAHLGVIPRWYAAELLQGDRRMDCLLGNSR